MSDLVTLICKIVLPVLIGGLFFMKELSECAAPLHLWLIVEWIGLALITAILLSETLRMKMGEKAATIIIAVFCFNTFAGSLMLFYSLARTPKCLPKRIYAELIAFAIVTSIGFVVGVCLVCSKGIRVFNQKFHRESETVDIIDQIKAGTIDVEEYITNHNSVDKYALFPRELTILKEECAMRPGRQLEEDDECCICMDNFLTEGGVIEFPICKHMYHAHCLDEWLARKTTCPMCRGGIRSSLYRHLANKYGHGQNQNEAEQPQNHEAENLALANPVQVSSTRNIVLVPPETEFRALELATISHRSNQLQSNEQKF